MMGCHVNKPLLVQENNYENKYHML